MRKFFKTLVPVFLLCIAIRSHSQRYLQIHESAIVVDTHNDVLSTASMKGLDLGSDLSGKTMSDIARFKKGGVDVQIFSIFCDDQFGKDTAFKYANIEIDSLYAIAARNKGRMMIVTNPKELQIAVKAGKLAAMMGVEGGHMIEDKIEYLDSFYKRGVRYMTLTWNNSTSWATSARDETFDSVLKQPKGLNDWGKALVKHMNELGMLVDISHTGERTFWDAIHTSTKPVIASHSSVYKLCPVFRNLKDDQIKAIAKNGGVIQINFYSGFIDSSYHSKIDAFMKKHQHIVDSLKLLNKESYDINEYLSTTFKEEAQALRPPLSLLLDHIDYIVKLVGVDYVGIGSDFDGIESAPQGLDGVQDLPKLTRALVDRGYSETDIKKILGGNFIRVFKANAVSAK